MTGRAEQRKAFLARSGWEEAAIAPLAGDASFRRYYRLRHKDGTPAVLMDAPPDKEPVAPFAHVAEYLTDHAFSAPKILEQDVPEGFLLLEDLGDHLYSRYLLAKPQEERALYENAVSALKALHRLTPPTLAPYTIAELMRELELFSEWFLPASGGKDATGFLSIWKSLLEQSPLPSTVAVLRDYHADNLLWLPERQGLAKVGMLDFQDALLGHPAYDLVSLLEDARRDVTAETVSAMLEHYTQDMMADEKHAFLNAYALLGAQRNLKIIGIFTRLWKRDGKPHYLSYFPRVWGHIEKDLQHPLLTELQDWMNREVPSAKRILAA